VRNREKERVCERYRNYVHFIENNPMSPLDRHCGHEPLHPSQFSLSETSLWRDGESKCLKVTKMMERKKGRKIHKVREGGQRTAWESKAVRDTRSSLHFLSFLRSCLLLLLLSVCDDVADVLVVNIASHIWGEGGPQVLHLKEEEQRTRIKQTLNCFNGICN